MKVGDLVRYKKFPCNGFGIVLRNTDGLLDLYWFDDCSDYICDDWREFEVYSASR